MTQIKKGSHLKWFHLQKRGIDVGKQQKTPVGEDDKKTNTADPPMTPAVSKETNLVAYYSSRQRHNPVIVCVTVTFLKRD